MCSYHTSQSRRDRFPSEPLVGPGRAGPSASLLHSSEQMSCHKECVMLSPNQQDWQCPVCLQPASFPVQTNCGHLFCAPCLISYWRHGSWLDAISCPLCRQKVSELCRLFNESRSDRESKQVVGEIKDYNKRYSGAPRQVTDYLCDAPLVLQVLGRSLSTMAGLVWLFVFRVILCCVGTVVSISSPTVEPDSSPSAGSLGTDPSLCGLLGVLDDLVVVILLLICVININQQMVPDRSERSASTSSQGLIGWTDAEFQ
ncbi:RING-HC_RNF170 domain-containing protein [Betta splendens]|uniref:RING-HC_RNF170 domain-containing protein n=1 Tax=Betta splendens TaxID=158456 RepID=A0A6P7M8K6_BETSP|nr:RING-HC_RNF170 domain-containing protein [Betta splendens]XP_029002915.1 RING-HC_RNF170 domain-containing protein [Betta splendens]